MRAPSFGKGFKRGRTKVSYGKRFHSYIEVQTFEEKRARLYNLVFEFEAFLPRSVESVLMHIVKYFKFFVKPGNLYSSAHNFPHVASGFENNAFQRDVLKEMLQKASPEFHKKLTERLIAEEEVF